MKTTVSRLQYDSTKQARFDLCLELKERLICPVGSRFSTGVISS
ncbi:hypothetical protein ACWOFR_14490 [Carnobacterium gallinarum]